jgi:hypothetical protein
MSTAQQLVTRAMRRLQAIDINSEPSPAEMSHGLDLLSELINGWRSQGIPSQGQTVTGDLTSGSDIVCNIDPGTASIYKLLNVSGTGVPASTKVEDVLSATAIRLSADATADGAAVTLTFAILPVDVSIEGAVIALLAVRMSEDLGVPVSAKLQLDADRGWSDMLALMMPNIPAVFDPALTNMPSQRLAGTGLSLDDFNG